MPSAEQRRFLELVEPQLAALYRYAYRLYRNESDAEDLFQEVCMRALEQLETLASVNSRQTWLARVAYNLFIDRLRADSRARFESLSDERYADGLIDSAPGLVDQVECDQMILRLERAWQTLTCDQQALLGLSSEGYTLTELVEITEIPLGALKARLHRARVRLGNRLRSQEQPPQMKVVMGDGNEM